MREMVKLRLWPALMGLIALAALAGNAVSQPAAAQSGTCSTFTPAGYSVTVCINQPQDDATLSGPATVAATVQIVGSSAKVSSLHWYLDGSYLLLDLAAPYTFLFPTDVFADGLHTLAVEARLNNGYISPLTQVQVHLGNGNATAPPNTRSFSPVLGAGEITLAAVGDAAGSRPESITVGDFIAGRNLDMVLYLGDVYEKGTYTEFFNWYGQPDQGYGRLKGITNPIVGNHEYNGAAGAADYFYFWDNIPHYYSFDAGGWHIVGLDSTSQYNQLLPGKAQYTWLANDLAANTLPCVMVMFHHPRYSVGPQGDAARTQDVWALLAQNKVEVALTGHDHSYQRWAALDASGAPDPNGITQFVSGAGGHGTQAFARSDTRMVYGSTAYGVLFMALAGDGLTYEYVTPAGQVLDAGTVTCDGAAPPPTFTPTPTATPTSTPTFTPTDTPTLLPGAPTDTPTLTPTPTPTSADNLNLLPERVYLPLIGGE